MRERLLILGLRRLRRLPLRIGEVVDTRAVLRADVVALAHALRRVMALPERLQELLVAELLRIVDDEHDLIVPGLPGAHLLIGRIGREAAGVANCGDPDAGAEIPELA